MLSKSENNSFMIRDDSNRRSNAIQRLRDAGLYVDSAGNSTLLNRISRRQDDVRLAATLQSKSLNSPIATDYWSNEWPWIFRHWLLMPGPGIDDFQCEFATVEAGVEAVLSFYFGHATIIDNWLVPLHRHPELLSETHVRAALSRATAITATQFEIMQEEQRDFCRREAEKRAAPMKAWWSEAKAVLADELVGKDELEQLEFVGKIEFAGGKLPPRPKPTMDAPYESPFQFQFLGIQHAEETTKTLRLRRDLQEVYIVSGR